MITDKEQQFYKDMGMPLPTVHPDVSMQRLMAQRNELKLFHRKCDKTGEPIISAYPAETTFPVWKNEIWWGDSWDGCDYGQEYDFDRPFFEQFKALQDIVPREGTSVFRSENCDYNGHIRDSKNCYLNSLVAGCEDTHYSYWMVGNKDVVDCAMTNRCELCYDSVDLENCYDCIRLEESANCQNCYFSYGLTSCDHCIGCSNLQQKSYHVFNKKVTPAEFETLKKQIFNGKAETYLQGVEFLEKAKTQGFHRAVHNLKSENVTGNHLFSSKNCFNCFDGHENEDCKDCISLDNTNDTYRCYSAGWPKCEMTYLSAVSRGSTNIAGCYYTFFGQDLRYCDSTQYSQNCFGCIGLNHKQYCILNKSYTQEEYKNLLPRVIQHMKDTGEWGQYFPPSCSTFAYNDSVAGMFFPIEKQAALKLGYQWRDHNDDVHASTKKDMNNPDIIICEESGRPFRIQSGEQKFYQKMNLPRPVLHPEIRMERLIDRRHPRHLWERKCALSAKNIWTCYSPNRKEKVISEEEYRKMVF